MNRVLCWIATGLRAARQTLSYAVRCGLKIYKQLVHRLQVAPGMLEGIASMHTRSVSHAKLAPLLLQADATVLSTLVVLQHVVSNGGRETHRPTVHVVGMVRRPSSVEVANYLVGESLLSLGVQAKHPVCVVSRVAQMAHERLVVCLSAAQLVVLLQAVLADDAAVTALQASWGATRSARSCCSRRSWSQGSSARWRWSQSSRPCSPTSCTQTKVRSPTVLACAFKPCTLLSNAIRQVDQVGIWPARMALPDSALTLDSQAASRSQHLCSAADRSW